MKERLTIGEFAKLRKTTTETLRHYDRIGLLKPIEIDPHTGYRYYSILQHEQLGTIKELRELGMSIEEIKHYLNQRNVEKSMSILENRRDALRESIKKMQMLEESITEKIECFNRIKKEIHLEYIEIKSFTKRKVITLDTYVENVAELDYMCVQLESMLRETAPILASNRIGTLLADDHKGMTLIIFIKEQEGIAEKYIKDIPKGEYVCVSYKGKIDQTYTYLEKIKTFITKHQYEIIGDVLQVIQLDITVTGKEEEMIIEIQVPIKR